MIDFGAIEPGLQTIFAALTGIASTSFEERAGELADDTTQAECHLSIFASGNPGSSTDRFYVRAEGFWGWGCGWGSKPWCHERPEREQRTGTREFTLRVKVTAYDPIAVKTARFYLEQARGRLELGSTVDAFVALGLGLGVTNAIVPLGNEGDRTTSIAAMDLRFFCCSNAVDLSRYYQTIKAVGAHYAG